MFKLAALKKDKNSHKPILAWHETEVWVADFGSPEIEELLKKEVIKLKPREPKLSSWIFASLVLLAILVLVEYAILWCSDKYFWPWLTLLIVFWLWRLLALLAWLYLGKKRWLWTQEKVLAVAFLSFILASIVLAIIKIIFAQSFWAWLNLLIEPIWTILLVAVVSWLYFKIKK
jgi:magnesium-transporting ATPase (P-type)